MPQEGRSGKSLGNGRVLARTASCGVLDPGAAPARLTSELQKSNLCRPGFGPNCVIPGRGLNRFAVGQRLQPVVLAVASTVAA